jgi:hypothetical protein
VRLEVLLPFLFFLHCSRTTQGVLCIGLNVFVVRQGNLWFKTWCTETHHHNFSGLKHTMIGLTYICSRCCPCCCCCCCSNPPADKCTKSGLQSFSCGWFGVTLQPGQSVTATYTAVARTAGVFTNKAESKPYGDKDGSNNEATAVVTVTVGEHVKTRV